LPIVRLPWLRWRRMVTEFGALMGALIENYKPQEESGLQQTSPTDYVVFDGAGENVQC